MRALFISTLLFAVQSLAWANEPPIANAGGDRAVYTGDAVNLFGAATDAENDPIQWWWWNVIDSPAGSSWELLNGNAQNALFQPFTPGRYLVTLIVDDGFGTSAPDTIAICVANNLPPVAIATADKTEGPAPLTVQFDGSQSYDPEGKPIVMYLWEFGDGSAPSLAATPPPHTYTMPGTYNVVILTVSDDRGANGTDALVITVADNLPPEASPTATPSFGEAPLTVQFAANATDPNNDPLTYAWNFGDPLSADNNSTLENPTHIYDQNGLYRVALDVCDGLATINRSITIRVGVYGIDYLLGDIDFDGDVDFEDVFEFAGAYLSENGDPDYNSDADLAPNNGLIDLCDFALLANDWGKTLP